MLHCTLQISTDEVASLHLVNACRSGQDGGRSKEEGEDFLVRIRAPFLLRAGRRLMVAAGAATSATAGVHVRLVLVRRPSPERGDAAPAERARDGAGDPRHVVGLDHRAQVQRALDAQLVPAHCDEPTNKISISKQ